MRNLHPSRRMILAAAVVSLPAMAAAQTVYNVTALDDNASEPGSLPYEINAANSAGSGQINFLVSGTMLLQYGTALPVITFSGGISGTTVGQVSVNGNGSRPFFIDSGAGSNFALSNMIITGGVAQGGAGGNGYAGGGGGLGAGGGGSVGCDDGIERHIGERAGARRSKLGRGSRTRHAGPATAARLRGDL
jgi:hypothetical protein